MEKQDLVSVSSHWWMNVSLEYKIQLVDKYFDNINKKLISMGTTRIQELYLLENPDEQSRFISNQNTFG